jgi:parallel beta-helix repeat protein
VLPLVILCLASLILISNVNSQSEGAIFINADGTISGTSKIQRNGNVYTLMDSFYNSPITVQCNNIILDGAGFVLKGPTGWVSGLFAINLTCSNVTVRNFNIIGFYEVGILGAYNSNNVYSNNITETDRAISIYADDYNVEGNYLADNDVGIRIVGKNNNITKNHILNNFDGFFITNSTDNRIIANRIERNGIAVNTDYGGFQVYHNNFINQTIGSDGSWSALILSTAYFSEASNKTLKPDWDNDYPSGGNYWSDYTTRYPNATEIENSGIGNTQYIIGTSTAINSTQINTYIVEAIDRYPLLSSFTIPEPIIPISSSIPQPTNPPPTTSLTPTPTEKPEQIEPSDETLGTIILAVVFLVPISLLIYLVIRKHHENAPGQIQQVAPSISISLFLSAFEVRKCAR